MIIRAHPERPFATVPFARAAHAACGVFYLLGFWLLLLAGPPARAENLVRNGDFSQMSGGSPVAWTAHSWAKDATTAFARALGTDGFYSLVMRSAIPNDMQWTQTVKVQPDTWYLLMGSVRAIGVGPEGRGANLSLMRGHVHAGSVRGEDSGWQEQNLYFKSRSDDDRVTLACRLGGPGALSTGEARCRGIALIPIATPGPDATPVYDDLPARDYAAADPKDTIDAQGRAAGRFAALAILVVLALAVLRFGAPPRGTPGWESTLLLALLAVLLAAKLLVAPLFMYAIDFGTYQAWALRLVELGPAGFYSPGYFADYPPGYMYALWGIGGLFDAFVLPVGSPVAIRLIKLPALLADGLIAWLIFARLREQGARLAWGAALAFALNPALIFTTAIWGQTDSLLALCGLLAFLAAGRRQFELAWVLGVLAVLVKPQGLIFLPLLALWPWGWWRGGRAISSALAGLLTILVVADPFRAGRPWSWLIELYAGTANGYPETSVNAMNLAGLLFGMRRADGTLYGWLSAFDWGLVIGLAVGALFLLAYLLRRDRQTYTYLLAAAVLVAFVCLTRMHERYLYPFFVFAVLLGLSGRTARLYWTLSALFLVNLVAVYRFQEYAWVGPDWLWQAVATLMTLAMLGWLHLTWQVARGQAVPRAAAALAADDRIAPSLTPSVTQGQRAPWTIGERTVLIGILLVAAILRLWDLALPTQLVFDEVYFVEQARNYLAGKTFMDPHPPFAKLMIALGIASLGDEPFGWRIANALTGTALVAFMYLLARELFGRRLPATLAAAFVAIDGLLIVDSRIAVIDIHYLTWGVAAYWLTLRLINDRAFQDIRRLVLIGLVIGVSVGAKLFIPFFSFLLVLGMVAWTGQREALAQGRPVLRFLLRPIGIIGIVASVTYVAVYAPHFLWGWWDSPLDLLKYLAYDVRYYQAAVADATHPYSSKWWSWPLMLKPISYHWQDPAGVDGMVVEINAMGHPALWWAALPALILAGVVAFRDRCVVAGLLVVGWAIHLLPWVWIGRTLFLYHYLPSLMFAFLALAWMLDRTTRAAGTATERGLTAALALLALLPFGYQVAPQILAPALGVLILGWVAMLVLARPSVHARVGAVLVGAFSLGSLGVAAYLLPLWIGAPVERGFWEARAWLANAGIWSWM